MRGTIAFSTLLCLSLALGALADINQAPVGSITHCDDPQSYCLETLGDPSKYSVTNSPGAYGECENLHYDHKFAGTCVFANNNRKVQELRIECSVADSYCVVTLGDIEANSPTATRFQCFGQAKAAWTGQGDDMQLKGNEAGVVFAKASGDNLKAYCPNPQ